MNTLLEIVLLLIQLSHSPIGKCDPIDGPKLNWSTANRQAAREMANNSLRSRGAWPIFVAFLDSATSRESLANASLWHDDGTGLGLHGINITTHAKRWPSPLNPALCDPRVSAALVQDIAADCIARHEASTPWEIQACFAGRFECVGDGNAKVCTSRQQDRTTAAICERMEQRGFGCHAPIGKLQLGRRLTREEKRSWDRWWN